MNALKFSELSTLSLLNRLRSSQDDEVVVAIILELVIRNDDRVIDTLIELTSADSEIVRLTAVWALGEFANTQTIEPLIDAMLRELGDVVPAGMEALRRIGDPAVKPLVAALDTSNEEDVYILGDAIAHVGTVKAYEEVCKVVDSVNPIARTGAAIALGGLRNPDGISYLLTLTEDTSSLVRANAAFALQFAHNNAAVGAALLVLLDDIDDSVVENAVVALGYVGGADVVTRLIDILSYNAPELVVAAVRALNELDATEATPHLHKLLNSPNESLRSQVVIALQHLGSQQDVPALLTCLEQEVNKDVLYEIGHALGKLGDASLLNKLPTHIAEHPALLVTRLHLGDDDAFQYFLALSRSHEVDHRLDAIWALAGDQHKRAIPPLIAALLDGEWDVRSEAATALANPGAKQATRPLAHMLTRDEIPLARESAAYALGEIGNPQSAGALVHAMQYDDAEVVRAAAADALGKVGNTDAVRPLIVACLDVSESVRTAAAQSLSKLGNPTALPSLQTLLKDQFVAPRVAAREAIARIKDK
jgi:HEAT repeat protein